jgi:6-phosphogluconolactonase (cycloisomerase 2 family)
MNNDPRQNTSRSLPDYRTFRVSPNGKLIAVPHSVITVPHGSNPSQALISPLGPFVFGADFLGGVLQSFVMERNGRLQQHSPQTLPESEFSGANINAPRLPLGLQAHPRWPIVYVGFVTINRLGVYQHDAQGKLSFVASVPSSGEAICWLAVNRTGTRLFSANTADNSISVFDLTNPFNPAEIQKVTLRGPGNPLQLALDPQDKFLHVVSQRALPSVPVGEGNVLHVLRINSDGTLVEVAGSPTTLVAPIGTRSQGVVAF